MKKPKLTAELFTFPHNGKHVIYAPFRHVMVLGNEATVNLLADIKNGTFRKTGTDEEKKTLKILREKGIIDGEPEKHPVSPNSQEFHPTAVTLFPTNQCNMSCIYCYASAGEARPKNMPWTMAKAAIDIIAENARKLNQNRFSVGFHGGGEPTLPWSFFTKCVEYSKELGEKIGKKVTCSVATNLVFTSKQVEWIIKNMDSLSISLDGTPDIQNIQRPLANGKESYDIVANNIKILDEAKFNYGLRSTITKFNVLRLKEIVSLFLDEFNPRSIQFEPLFLCGRCQTTNVEAPDAKVFIREFLKANKLAEKKKMKLAYSGLRLGGVTSTFCGACGSNFCVTPEGNVTSCFEVVEKDDPRSQLFFYGIWKAKEKKYEFWEDKRQHLASFNAANIPYCADCIAKWHCAGDCLAKVSYTSDVEGDRGSERCWMNQEITKRKIKQMFKKPPKSQSFEKLILSEDIDIAKNIKVREKYHVK
ncbi:radical SAM protein [candidate division KSB1 bacterium]|nr:radical SAM protein [candidate division KSB1 bacterium]